MTKLLKLNWVKWTLISLGLLISLALVVFVLRNDILRRLEGLPPFTHSAGDRFDMMVMMRDGVELYTFVQLPAGEGPFPTVLVRSPYHEVSWAFRNILGERFVRYGYACVTQDVRGQGGSGGIWDPGVNNEIADGHDTLLWLVEQDFQNGNIAMVGSSYLSSVQYAAVAGGAPEELKTIIPSMFTTDIRKVMYQDGMFRHELYTAWASMMRESASALSSKEQGAEYQKAIRHRPHNEVDTEIFGLEMPWYTDMLTAMNPHSDYWQVDTRVAIRETPENMTIPVLMIAGWYDIFTGPQLEDWQRLATRSESRLILGPWTHSGSIGEYPMPGSEGGQFQWAEMLPWLDHHLKGEPLTLAPGVKLYVIGKGAWEERVAWPTSSNTQTFYLSDITLSNDCTGGVLADKPDTGEVSYTYDPDNPVPSRGGGGMLAYNMEGYGGAPPSNVDQSGFCERDDVLTFTSESFKDGLFVSGNISVTLEVSSTAPDTAFTAKLIEVFPDGSTFNIRDSITSLAYRNGSAEPIDYIPGEKVSITIDFWPIAWQLQPGSLLRLDISSSNFPKFHAHTNRAGVWSEQTRADIAVQTIYGGRVDLQIEL
ncbi:MAG: CocE/NonD family hydrolase [Spirochaetes bacterium]|nr:CocE/NonD family hydrolase [Spirochaetota bacterium]MBU0956302.1 CocE/NonD family hydrolase [Spirochaetota bacterium]